MTVFRPVLDFRCKCSPRPDLNTAWLSLMTTIRPAENLGGEVMAAVDKYRVVCTTVLKGVRYGMIIDAD